MVKKIQITIFIFIFLNQINAQENNSFKKIETGNWLELSYRVVNEDNEIIPFACIERIPEFPGGFDELAKFFKETLKYPKSAIKDSIEGRVITRFSIDKKGKVVNVHILKGVRNDLDSTCINAISIMPDWIRPDMGIYNNMIVQYTLPVRFSLR